MDPLLATLRRIRRRLLLVRATEAGLAGLAIAGAVGLAATLVRMLWPGLYPAAWADPVWPIACLPLGFVVGFGVRFVQGASLEQAAAGADRAAGLKERLATALEILEADTTRPAGVLDGRLLEEARTAAADLAARDLRLSRDLGRRARAALAVTVALVAGAFVPSRGGVPVSEEDARRAAGLLEEAADRFTLAPDVRAALDRAVAEMRRGAAWESRVDRATADVYKQVTEADRRRAAAEDALAQVDDPAFERIASAAGRGDGPGARAAAGDLARRVKMPPEEGGLPEAGRLRLAEGLRGAASRAKKADVSDLADPLSDAAEAVRTGRGADEAMAALADEATEALAPVSTEDREAVLAYVRGARSEAGLVAEPAAPTPATTLDASPEAVTPVAPSKKGPLEGRTVVAAPVPPEVRPEDRAAVRRYFGG